MEQRQRKRLSVQIFTGITLTWLILCYLTWVGNGCKAFMPFISDFDLYQPGDFLFSLGTMLSSVSVIWVMFELQLHNREQLNNNGAGIIWHLLNHSAIVPGMIAAYSCYMVGQTPWNVNGYMHGSYAFDIFYKGIYWCILVNIVTIRVHWNSSSLRKILIARLVPSFVAIVGLWQMVVAQSKVWADDFDWDTWNESTHNMMEFCTSSKYPLLNNAAMWEFLLVLGIVFTVFSFMLDLRPAIGDELLTEEE
jgi:hypothetical protein